MVSRTAGQELLFGDVEKETFQRILLKQVKFSGVTLVAWCFMGNHFHLVIEVPDKESSLITQTEAMVLDRLQVFRDELSTRFLLSDLETCRSNEDLAGVTAIANRVRARLFDLSRFMKELKQRMTLAYNLKHERSGTLWEGRFKSVLLESGDAVKMVAAYVDLNPVRAGLVTDPKDYHWCSYAAAVGGMRVARDGLVYATQGHDPNANWQKASENYRLLLFGVAAKSHDPKAGERGSITQEQARAVFEAGGKLTLAEALRCRIRYFTSGVALGSRSFIENFFAEKREYFGERRTSGARPIRGADLGRVFTVRALRVDPIEPPAAVYPES
ncbi:MAG: putative transposase [Verrucomicrobiales bacterium]